MHHHHFDREERAYWHFAGRRGGPEDWGRGPRGGRGGWGGGAFRVGKMLADGDLRLIVLALLEEGPRHGYEIIKALEEKSSGIYSPSPGVVYPTLTYLEEVGYATAIAEGAKKVYSITDAGRAHLKQNREVADLALSGIEKFGRKMAQARTWWEGQRHGEEPCCARPRHPRRRPRSQRGPPRAEDGDRREARRFGRRTAPHGRCAAPGRRRDPQAGHGQQTRRRHRSRLSLPPRPALQAVSPQARRLPPGGGLGVCGRTHAPGCHARSGWPDRRFRCIVPFRRGSAAGSIPLEEVA